MESMLFTILNLVVAAFLIFANAFFVAAEFSLVSVRRTRIEELVAEGSSSAQTVKQAIRDPDRFIAATQLGITMASLGLGWIGEPAIAHLIEPLFGFLSAEWAAPATHAFAAGAIAFTLITFLHVVIGELAPKSIALGYPEQTALRIAKPTLLFETIFRPAIWILNGTGNWLVGLVGLRRPSGHQFVHSVEELKMLVSASTESGELEPHEKEMLHNVFEFDDKLVREVMIPRTEMVAIEENTTAADLLQTFSEHPHTRFPIYTESVDRITGFLAIKDVLRAISEHGAKALDEYVKTLARPILFVPESKHIGALFAEMKAQKTTVAIVIDEFGGTAGMVTDDQLIEEIVGRVADGLSGEEKAIETIDENTAQIDAHLRIDEANEQLKIDLPKDDNYETVAGLILFTLRRIPKEGDALKIDNVKLTVMEMSGPKIDKVMVKRVNGEPHAA
ncbi:MAG: HlyC/CorC family transporter [Chloroflexi bacterium]|nr:HlyC/CorC family transporter [Chloroflexota bacterium]